MIDFSTALIFFVLLAKSFEGLNMLGTIEKQSLCFVRLRAEEIGAFILGMFFRLRAGGVMALEVASIYLTDSKQKVKGGFGLRSNGFLNGLIPSVFLTAVLLSFDMDREP